MSTVSSVASSYSSFSSSTGLKPEPHAVFNAYSNDFTADDDASALTSFKDGSKTNQVSIEHDGVEEVYSNDFTAEDVIVEITTPVLVDATERDSRTEQPQDDEDDYNDEEFEVADDSEHLGANGESADGHDEDDDAREYSDDWSQNEALPVEVPSGFDQDKMTIQPPVPCDKSIQHPGNDLVELTSQWASRKLRRLQQTKSIARSTKPQRASHCKIISRIDSKTSAELLRRLHRKRAHPSESMGGLPNHEPSIPKPWIERVLLHKVLAFSSTYPPPLTPPTRRINSPRPLRTFCSVKIADLQGRLATQQLCALTRRWETSPEDDNGQSIAVAEFLTSILRQQRQVLRPSDTDDSSILVACKTLATDMDRAVETATYAVRDTKALLQDAHRILHAAEAHKCTCSVSSSTL